MNKVFLAYKYTLQAVALLGVILLCSVFTLSSVSADEKLARSGEAIVKMFDAQAKTEKEKRNIEIAAGKRLKTLKTTDEIVLYRESTYAFDKQTDDEDNYIAYTRNHLCEKLRRYLRKQKKSGKKVVRRPSCEGNYKYAADLSPNDQYYSLEWGLHQQNDIDINAPEAWDISTGSSDVVVAVLDTGIDYNHPDLAANMWTNPNEIPGNGIDDDNNGVIDDIYGINAVADTGDPMDDNGHGTHCAGTIGAVGNNNIGVVGVAWNVKLMALKAFNSSGTASTFDIIQAHDYMVDLKETGVANIVTSSNSWSGGAYSQLLADSINRAKNADILFVAAAGNNGRNVDTSPKYPVAYNNESIIAVAAIESNGNLAGYSNFGLNNVDLAAPGSLIASTYVNGRYVYLSGTSMATPHVSGAIALLKAYAPGFNWLGLKTNLLDNTKTLDSLSGAVSTGGMLDVHAMLLDAMSGPPPTPTNTPPPTPTSIPTATPTVTPTPTATATPYYPPGIRIITGSVTININGQSQPVAVARVQVRTDDEVLVGYTGPSGVYSIKVQGPASYEVTVQKAGYEYDPVSGFLTNSDVVHNFVGTVKSYTLSGTAIKEDHSPLADVLIDGGELGTTTTNANGYFSFTVEHGKEYTLTASKADYYFATIFNGIIYGPIEVLFAAVLD